MQVALTIAGSDSSGGAGIQADLKTFARFGVFGTSVLTLVTAQNTQGVTAVVPLEPSLVAAQYLAVYGDLPIAAAKLGALGTRAIITQVAALLRDHPVPALVVDPVMVSKHGHALLDDDAVAALRDEIVPLATVLTPNLYEAGLLIGRQLTSVEDLVDAAHTLAAPGRTVLVKGGALAGEDAVDVLCLYGEVTLLRSPRLQTRHLHGTGCTLSAAIAAHLALGVPVREAIEESKAWVARAIAHGPDLGAGVQPLHHGVD